MIKVSSVVQIDPNFWLISHENELIYCKELKLRMLRKHCANFKAQTKKKRFSDMGPRHQHSYYCSVCQQS